MLYCFVSSRSVEGTFKKDHQHKRESKLYFLSGTKCMPRLSSRTSNCTSYATESHKYDMTVVMNVAAAGGEPKSTSSLNNVLPKVNASFLTHTSCCEISMDVLIKKKRHLDVLHISACDNSQSQAANFAVGVGYLQCQTHTNVFCILSTKWLQLEHVLRSLLQMCFSEEKNKKRGTTVTPQAR